MKRLLLTGTAALMLAGCASSYVSPPEPRSETMPPESSVTLTEPANALSILEQQVLLWDDDTRAARFRAMEDYFPGMEVAAGQPRELATGASLSTELQTAISEFVASTNAAGIMVLVDGKVRHEQYGLGLEADQRWTSFSVAKSFTSMLVGAAMADGHIASLSDPVSQYIAGLKGSAYDDVTVEQLLTMTSGVRWDENYSDPNSDVARMFGVTPVAGESQVVTYMKTLPREAEAGEKWVYKTGETNLIGVLLEEATGRSLADYAKEKIVDPAGFAGDLFWMRDLSGGNIGGCCLSLRLSDYARFGQFALEGGGNVTPSTWVGESTKAQVDLGGGFGYGYQWWTYPQGAYGAQGIFGQAITIVPERKLVVALVSNWPTATSNDQRRAWQALVTRITAEAN